MKAFPNEFESSGMELRDYFAAKAMQGFVAEGKCLSETEIIQIAWSIADKMMEARKK